MLTINDTEFDEAAVSAVLGPSYLAFETDDIVNLGPGDVIDAQSWNLGLVHFFVTPSRKIEVDWDLRNEILKATKLIRAAAAIRVG